MVARFALGRDSLADGLSAGGVVALDDGSVQCDTFARSMSDKTVEADSLPPEPESTGVIPNQDAAATVEGVVVDRPGTAGIRSFAMSTVIEGLPHGVTGIAAQRFLHVSTARMEAELAEAKAELKQARSDLDAMKDKWHRERTRVAVLARDLAHARESRLLRSVLLTVGGVVAGSAGKSWWLAVGIALLLVGWFWPTKASTPSDAEPE